MKFRSLNSNAFFCVVVILALCACKTTEQRKQAKEKTLISLHLETNPDNSPRNAPVPIYRGRPTMVNIMVDPFLTNENLDAASVVEVAGGFAIQLKFNTHAARTLEVITVANHGKRIAINCAFPDKRWLAAPIISKKISDGLLIFTPDADREETERIVRGLNNVAKKVRSGDWLKN